MTSNLERIWNATLELKWDAESAGLDSVARDLSGVLHTLADGKRGAKKYARTFAEGLKDQATHDGYARSAYERPYTAEQIVMMHSMAERLLQVTR